MGSIERFNRTLKHYMSKWMVLENTTNWIDVLDDILYNYNHTFQRGIQKIPALCTLQDEQEIYIQNLKKNKQAIQETSKHLPKVGDFFRVKLPKTNNFTKEGQTYSNKVFTTARVNRKTITDTEGNRHPIENIQVIPSTTNTRTTRETSPRQRQTQEQQRQYKAERNYNRLMQ